MPRLAIVSAHTSPAEAPSTGDAGGMNVYLAAVLPELARLGWEIDVFTRGAADARADARAAFSAGVDLVEVAVDDDIARPLDKYALAGRAGSFADAVARAAGTGTEPYAAVHSHYWVSGLVGIEAARRLGIPHVHSMHSAAATKNARLAPGDRPEPVARVDAERRVLEAADAVVVSGPSERDAVLAGYPIPAERMHLIAPGVDPAFHPRPGARTADRPLVALVGRVQPLKGQLLAVEALGRIRPDRRPVLVLAGAANPGRNDYLDEVRAAIDGLGLGDDVVLAGALTRADTAELLAVADLALVPSSAETFGLVALEAAACGTPVLARRTSGLVDAVVDGVTGVLIGSGDAADWARAIEDLLEDEALRLRLSAGSLAWAAGKTWAHTAAALDALYRGLL